ncbi:MAG: phosphoribosylamine--glycine ligase [Bacteroidales bacterium]|nr:phosphoribosylamine--glycine ligase [Bacteroidales bacterium]
MNILLVGSGGREHALAWKLTQSAKCNKLFIAPGNAGTASLGTNIDIGVNNFEALANAAIEHNINMLVIGPEEPLVNGLHDYFADKQELRHIAIVGPKKEGARLEGSKDFSKKFMQRHNIPTAKYFTATIDNHEQGKAFLDSMKGPYVLKADGLAAGKGVIIEPNLQTAKNLLGEYFNGKFGKAGEKVVIEEFLDGIELSVFVLTDGDTYVTLPEAKDYKRIGEGDTGPNTGGMGAISPVPFANSAFKQKIDERIVKPTINGLKNDGIDFTGFIFFGLIKVNDEPMVIEYNVRLGDPEAEAVLTLVENDLVELFERAAAKKLKGSQIKLKLQTAATVIMVSGGYPGPYQKGKVISMPPVHGDSMVFHAGTTIENNRMVTNGGRVLAVTSHAATMQEALAKSYATVSKIGWDGSNYRKDIGFDLNS